MFQSFDDSDLLDRSFGRFFQERNARENLIPNFKTDPRSHMFTPPPFNFGAGFEPINDALHVDELADRYIVLMKDVGGLEGKEFKVDYSKDLNQLTVTMTKTITTQQGTSNSSSQNSVSFDKPIDYNSISSDIQGDSLIITALKAVGNRLENDNRHFIEGIATNTTNGGKPPQIEDEKENDKGPTVEEVSDDESSIGEISEEPSIEEVSDEEPAGSIEEISEEPSVEEISEESSIEEISDLPSSIEEINDPN